MSAQKIGYQGAASAERKRANKQRATVADNPGRLTRAARRGYVSPVAIKAKRLPLFMSAHARRTQAR